MGMADDAAAAAPAQGSDAAGAGASTAAPPPSTAAEPAPPAGAPSPDRGAGGADKAPDAGGADKAPDAGGADKAPDAGGADKAPDAGGADKAPDAGGADKAPDAGGADKAPDEEQGEDGGEDAEADEEEQEPPGPQLPNLLLFRKWNLEGIEIHDPGLASAISLRRMILPYTYGRSALKKFNKADANIVERLANKMMHFGKRYAKNTGRMAGKKVSVMRSVQAAFEIIHLQTGRNPVEVLVRAVEHSAPNEDTTRIVYGGAVYHVSVDVSPLRRVDLALRFIADGVKEAAFSRPRAVEECLADHLMLAAANDQNAPSVKKKHELERIAQASR